MFGLRCSSSRSQSGHLESLGQLWLSVFKAGARGYDPGHDPDAAPLSRPPSDASRRPFNARRFLAGARGRSGCRRSSVDRFSAPSGEIDHLFDPRGRACRRPGLLVAWGHRPPRPPSRASVPRRRSIYRERLAPTGNRAIPDDQTVPVIQAVPERYRPPRRAKSAPVSSLGQYGA